MPLPRGRGPAAGPGAGPARRTRRTAAAAGHRPKVGGGGGTRIGGLAAGAVSLSLSLSLSLSRSLARSSTPPLPHASRKASVRLPTAHHFGTLPPPPTWTPWGGVPGTGGGLGTRASRRRAAGRPTRVRFRGIRGAKAARTSGWEPGRVRSVRKGFYFIDPGPEAASTQQVSPPPLRLQLGHPPAPRPCARSPGQVSGPSCLQLALPQACPWPESRQYRPALLRAASRRRSRADGRQPAARRADGLRLLLSATA